MPKKVVKMSPYDSLMIYEKSIVYAGRTLFLHDPVEEKDIAFIVNVFQEGVKYEHNRIADTLRDTLRRR